MFKLVFSYITKAGTETSEKNNYCGVIDIKKTLTARSYEVTGLAKKL